MDKFEIKNKQEVTESRLEVKKSKFIARVYYITSQEDAEYIIDREKEEYKDARHVVYAYMLKSGGKYTDNKEPQGTAGKPIYSLLEKENIINVLIIVIRYFGGILLGTGPLTRAYSTVAKEALAKCEKTPYIEYEEKTINCEYKEEETTKRNLLNQNCIIKEIVRTDKVNISYLEPKGLTLIKVD